MCSPGAAAGAQGTAGVMSAYSQYEQGKLNQSYYNYLADQTDRLAGEVDKATEDQLSVISADSGRQLKEVSQNSKLTTSAQKAAMAANGVYSDSGTASDVIGDTIDKQALDEAAVKFNADQAMWQVKRQSINQKLDLYTKAIDLRTQGNNARTTANLNAFNTLVGSSANAGATFYNSKK